MCIYYFRVNNYFPFLFFFYIFVTIHFTNVVLKETLRNFSFMIKFERLEKFHSLVKYR